MSVLVKLKFTNAGHDAVFIKMSLTVHPHDVNILSAYYEAARFCEQFRLTDFIFEDKEIAYIQNSITTPCFDGYFEEIKKLMDYFGKDTLEDFLFSFSSVIICKTGYLVRKFTGIEIESI